jgi:hypothetical protein
MSKVRGRDYCRACGSKSLFTGLDLGFQPIANELVSDSSKKSDLFELHLRICKDCKLGQVQDVVTPQRLFNDYRYLSSVSSSFVDHAKDFVSKYMTQNEFAAGEWVLEIASNDGYLLQHFFKKGIQVLGVEPSVNVSEISRNLGIPTITDFFGKSLATKILDEFGYPKLIIANNVLAHVPDICDFMDGLELLTGSRTTVSIENPSMLNILKENQFDSIYHEHYSYLSAHAVSNLLNGRVIALKRIEEIETHGGSLRYTFIHRDNKEDLNDATNRIFREEVEFQLFEPQEWAKADAKISQIKMDLKDLMEGFQKEGKKVWGFGAAAKCCTLIHFVELQNGSILGIADSSREKQGWYIPNTGIEIVSPQEMIEANPDHIIVFAWNVFDEISSSIRKLTDKKIPIWRVIPTIEKYE